MRVHRADAHDIGLRRALHLPREMAEEEDLPRRRRSRRKRATRAAAYGEKPSVKKQSSSIVRQQPAPLERAARALLVRAEAAALAVHDVRLPVREFGAVQRPGGRELRLQRRSALGPGRQGDAVGRVDEQPRGRRSPWVVWRRPRTRRAPRPVLLRYQAWRRFCRGRQRRELARAPRVAISADAPPRSTMRGVYLFLAMYFTAGASAWHPPVALRAAPRMATTPRLPAAARVTPRS